jgi:hypothetical protein
MVCFGIEFSLKADAPSVSVNNELTAAKKLQPQLKLNMNVKVLAGNRQGMM